MKPGTKLTLTHRQQLQLTPQLRQMVHLLQLSAADLEQAVDEAVRDNPLLEKTEQTFPEEAGTLTAAPSALRRHEHQAADEETLAGIAAEPDLYDCLHAQVCEISDNERQAQLLHILIESLNEHGYLDGTLDDIIAHAPLQWNLHQDELAHALTVLQSFDPAGVGAKDIRESLLLQLARMDVRDAAVCCARTIVRDYFALLSQAGVLPKLKKKLPRNTHNIQAALDIIHKLNPYPDNGFNNGPAAVYVRPDLRVFKEEGVWNVAAQPHLRPCVTICQSYAQAVCNSDDSMWKQKLHEARMLLHNLKTRENTILQVARAVVARQQDFFEFGEAALNPLHMTEIATALGIHVSTVSRSVNQKYLLCPQGLFEMRVFFPKQVGGDTADQSMSSTAVKAHLAQWIDGEDKTRPFSDDALRDKLAAVGLNIARRTVAKYREELNIPSAYRRKSRE